MYRCLISCATETFLSILIALQSIETFFRTHLNLAHSLGCMHAV